LWFDRLHPKQNRVIRLKSKILAAQNSWAGYAAIFIERLLRTAQQALGSCMYLPENRVENHMYKRCGICFASGAAFEVIVASCFQR